MTIFRTALISGISGQAGSYLADLLLSKNYEVHGIVRRSSTSNLSRISHIADRITLHDGDLTDKQSLDAIVKKVQPLELYHLGAQSFVGSSFTQPETVFQTNALGTLRLLEAVKEFSPETRFYNASTSEMFGNANHQGVMIREEIRMTPASPYGISKLAAFHMVQMYRQAYDLFACNGIMFNYESQKRGSEFVTQKIAEAVARIKLGKQDTLELGNLEAMRDWGHAKDYVEAMWRMLQQDAPEDYVISTGHVRSIKEFCQIAFSHAGLNWENHVRINARFLRPNDVHYLCGDSTKAKQKLGWEPTITFEKLVVEMVDGALKRESAKDLNIQPSF